MVKKRDKQTHRHTNRQTLEEFNIDKASQKRAPSILLFNIFFQDVVPKLLTMQVTIYIGLGLKFPPKICIFLQREMFHDISPQPLECFSTAKKFSPETNQSPILAFAIMEGCVCSIEIPYLNRQLHPAGVTLNYLGCAPYDSYSRCISRVPLRDPLPEYICEPLTSEYLCICLFNAPPLS